MTNQLVPIRNIIAFTAGVLWTTERGTDYAAFPISTVFCASISGLFAVIGADFVGNLMPPVTNIMIIGTLGVSCFYYGSELLK